MENHDRRREKNERDGGSAVLRVEDAEHGQEQHERDPSKRPIEYRLQGHLDVRVRFDLTEHLRTRRVSGESQVQSAEDNERNDAENDRSPESVHEEYVQHERRHEDGENVLGYRGQKERRRAENDGSVPAPRRLRLRRDDEYKHRRAEKERGDHVVGAELHEIERLPGAHEESRRDEAEPPAEQSARGRVHDHGEGEPDEDVEEAHRMNAPGPVGEPGEHRPHHHGARVVRAPEARLPGQQLLAHRDLERLVDEHGVVVKIEHTDREPVHEQEQQKDSPMQRLQGHRDHRAAIASAMARMRFTDFISAFLN
jgi:hypothetical protein